MEAANSLWPDDAGVESSNLVALDWGVGVCVPVCVALTVLLIEFTTAISSSLLRFMSPDHRKRIQHVEGITDK